jgi:hypothetical protein
MWVVVVSALVWAAAEPPKSEVPKAGQKPEASQKLTAGAPGAQPTTPAASSKLTVAVLDFEAKEAGGPEMGAKVSDLLTIYLSTAGNFEVVERAKLKQVLGEQGLNLSGAVDPDQAVQAGRLVGAKLMVFGRAFSLGDELYLTAKVVSSETGRVAGTVVKAKMNAELPGVIEQLARSVTQTIEERGEALGLMPQPIDPVQGILAALKDVPKEKYPSFVVVIAEQHLAQPVIDPAAETEIQAVLRKAGLTVYEAKSKLVGEWAKAFLHSGEGAVPSEVAHADLIIVGEAFSEPAARFEELHSSKARLEVKVIDRRTGKVLAVDSSNTAAVDLSENAAGKKAIQKAAQNLAARLLPKAIQDWTQAQK